MSYYLKIIALSEAGVLSETKAEVLATELLRVRRLYKETFPLGSKEEISLRKIAEVVENVSIPLDTRRSILKGISSSPFLIRVRDSILGKMEVVDDEWFTKHRHDS